MIAPLRLPFKAFREISTGTTGPDGLAVLHTANLSRQYLLLRMVVEKLPAGALTGGMVKDALDLLAEVQRQRRPMFDELLTYPHIGAGLVRCLRELIPGGDIRSVGRYLATVAAAAAFHGDIDFDLGAAATAALHIPANGTARIGGGLPEIRMRQIKSHRTVGPITLPSRFIGESANWSAVRPLHTSDAAEIVLDDIDPDRGAGGLFPAGRLPPREFAIWRETFALAWNRLAATHPDWAYQIKHVVRAVTPLARQRPGQGRSASAWHAYGAVALTMPSDHLTMAATLVHEMQHSKLNALMTIIDLHDRARVSRHYSPWRIDPRPLHGLLHGCYAFLGVAAFWSAERSAGDGRRADFEFARAALQVRQALDTLSSAEGLTPAGREFVEHMGERLAGLPSSPMPETTRHLAELAVDDHRISWRLRSMTPPSPEVAAIAVAWWAGRPVPPFPVTARLESSVETFVPDDRLLLWSRLARNSVPDGDDADLLLARQATGPAAQRYLDALRKDAENTAAWAGLAMAAARIDGPGRQLWRHRPELIRAVHRALRGPGTEPPDPLALADWLGAG